MFLNVWKKHCNSLKGSLDGGQSTYTIDFQQIFFEIFELSVLFDYFQCQKHILTEFQCMFWSCHARHFHFLSCLEIILNTSNEVSEQEDISCVSAANAQSDDALLSIRLYNFIMRAACRRRIHSFVQLAAAAEAKQSDGHTLSKHLMRLDANSAWHTSPPPLNWSSAPASTREKTFLFDRFSERCALKGRD